MYRDQLGRQAGASILPYPSNLRISNRVDHRKSQVDSKPGVSRGEGAELLRVHDRNADRDGSSGAIIQIEASRLSERALGSDEVYPTVYGILHQLSASHDFQGKICKGHNTKLRL